MTRIPTDALSWKVTEAYDRGPQEFYRYHVVGFILDSDRDPVAFSWSVPSASLDNSTYDLSDALWHVK